MTPSAPSLTVRPLPAEEWHTLEAIEPFASRGLPDDPSAWWVLVVERETPDGSRQLVGTCSLFTAMHWDCWWIDPQQPGAARGVILRQLLREALALFAQVDVHQVYTGVEAQHAEVADLLVRFGFRPAAGQLFMLQVEDAALACSREV